MRAMPESRDVRDLRDTGTAGQGLECVMAVRLCELGGAGVDRATARSTPFRLLDIDSDR